MRLWTLHPSYLDTRGLVDLWREGLLARAVLLGLTKGYQHHPQLLRFRQHPEPLSAIDFYLEQVCLEAQQRGYHFDANKIISGLNPVIIPVNSGQVAYEVEHLKRKLAVRAPERLPLLAKENTPQVNPLFIVVPGDIESWEKIS
jgi:hypothetical protein